MPVDTEATTNVQAASLRAMADLVEAIAPPPGVAVNLNYATGTGDSHGQISLHCGTDADLQAVFSRPPFVGCMFRDDDPAEIGGGSLAWHTTLDGTDVVVFGRVRAEVAA